MPRLRTSSPNDPGWTRRRHGKGFRYLDALGEPLSREDRARCEALVIPPAWTDVWICPWPTGHIQVVGTDDAGRRQYRYHEEWRRQRDRAKHDRVLEVAERLPGARERVQRDLGRRTARDPMPRERALATAFRLLDLGFFRIGGESYAEANGSFGLATVEKQHVSVAGAQIVFDYVAKSGKDRHIAVADADVVDAVQTLRRRRGPRTDDLLAWRDARGWHDVSSGDINAYVKEVVGGDVSAKDFRTWHATVLAAVALAVSTHAATSATARKRAVSRAMQEVAMYLGNTPTVARSSYVDPRVVDLFEDGVTVENALGLLGDDVDEGEPATHGEIESAVLALLHEEPVSDLRAARRGRAPRTAAAA
ncbi:DNA topoisomerase IB [Pseudokineococcus basanitobsidens]|uniref:DNA topoisomerase n=1 Tax=Pseudokineococcus basanitobsidens TaxID=1926649 RepID=A0ABU8RLG7_9ACTN